MLRIDPATGNGLPSNPYYDAANPRSARSRVWALGLRNPFRMGLQPNTGSHFPPDGNPGVLYVGHVGWNTWEALDVVTGPKQNFGWPIYEGLSVNSPYNGNVNVDFPIRTLQIRCIPPRGAVSIFLSDNCFTKTRWIRPGSRRSPIPATLRRPYRVPSRSFSIPGQCWIGITTTQSHGHRFTAPSGDAQIANVGDPGSPVSGTPFAGNCAIGGTWYTGTNFPAAYQNLYYFADWGQGLIKTLTFDANNKPVALNSFANCCRRRSEHRSASCRRHVFTTSLTTTPGGPSRRFPLPAIGRRSPLLPRIDTMAPTPLTVQFSSSGSYDPDGQPITYSWNFGDGSPVSTQANPAHTFTAPPGVPTKYVVTLTVTDSGQFVGASDVDRVGKQHAAERDSHQPSEIALSIRRSTKQQSTLTATVSDAESSDAQLSYQWQVLLHHNDHNHGVTGRY